MFNKNHQSLFSNTNMASRQMAMANKQSLFGNANVTTTHYLPLFGSTNMTNAQMAYDLAKHIIIQAIWEKGIPVAGVDPQIWRKDVCGAWIHRYDYGNGIRQSNSEYGWERDHITPLNKGGSNDISNLRPLHWKTNASRQDGPLTCRVTSYQWRNFAIY